MSIPVLTDMLFLKNMLLIYSEAITPRFTYVVDWITRQWNIRYQTARNLEEFMQATQPRIYYGSGKNVDKSIYNIPASGLLSAHSVVHKIPDVLVTDGVSELYFSPPEEGFDVLSAIFYMLSRYEEYLPFPKDEHGRFPGKESIAFKNDFIQKPVVDIWVSRLKAELQYRFPQLVFQPEKFEIRLTFDLDVAFKYRGRGLITQILSLGRDILRLNLNDVRERMQVLTGNKRDPWDIYDELIKMTQDEPVKLLFFIPGGKRTVYDRNLSLRNTNVQRLIKLLDGSGDIGLHASYFSTDKPKTIGEEKERLENVLGSSISKNRFHFLRFILPDAYHFLIEQGIKEEYSMIFPDMPGFRAGTCKPFYFYDLKNESATPLKIYSPCWMDSAFLHYRQTDGDDPIIIAMRLMKEINEVSGIFIPIFHNSDVAENDGMNELDRIIERAMKLIDDE